MKAKAVAVLTKPHATSHLQYSRPVKELSNIENQTRRFIQCGNTWKGNKWREPVTSVAHPVMSSVGTGQKVSNGGKEVWINQHSSLRFDFIHHGRISTPDLVYYAKQSAMLWHIYEMEYLASSWCVCGQRHFFLLLYLGREGISSNSLMQLDWKTGCYNYIRAFFST